MKVVTLMRHGPTEPGFGMPDAERALTEEGTLVVRRAARGLRGLGFDLGLASPLNRARQTAELVWQELALTAPLLFEPALASGRGPEEQLAALQASWDAEPEASSVLIVGHMPDVSQLTALVLREVPRVTPFVPGGTARILFDGAVAVGAGELDWMLRPEELAARAG